MFTELERTVAFLINLNWCILGHPKIPIPHVLPVCFQKYTREAFVLMNKDYQEKFQEYT